MSDLLPIPQPIPGETGQRPSVSKPRFIAQEPLEVKFTSAGVDVVVAHGLERVPIGYLVVGKSAGVTVYDGATPSSRDYLVLRATGAGTVRVLVL